MTENVTESKKSGWFQRHGLTIAQGLIYLGIIAAIYLHSAVNILPYVAEPSGSEAFEALLWMTFFLSVLVVILSVISSGITTLNVKRDYVKKEEYVKLEKRIADLESRLT